MSVKPPTLKQLSERRITLAFMKTPDLIELAQEQAALTAALAERLEMVEREKQDLLMELNPLESDDDCNKRD